MSLINNNQSISSLLAALQDAVNINNEEKEVIIAMAAVMMLTRFSRCRQLLMSWEVVLRKLQKLIKIRERTNAVTTDYSVRYCLSTKSYLVLSRVLSEEFDTVRHLLVTKTAFQKICSLAHVEKNHGWPEQLEVVIFLYWLASGTAYRKVAAKFDMPKSTVADIIYKVLRRFLRNLSKVVYIPQDELQLQQMGKKMSVKAESPAFSQAVGCLGTFSLSVKPSKSVEQIYSDHRGGYSIKCQVVCDYRGVFRDIFAGFPASMSDNQLLTVSPLYKKATFPPSGYYLFANSGYTYRTDPIAVVTPYVKSIPTPSQARFNEFHTKAFATIRKAVGEMKSRWFRIFNHKLDASNRLAPRIAVACVMLHNICTLDAESSECVTPWEADCVPSCTSVLNMDDLRERLTRTVMEHTPTPLDHSYLE